MAIHPELHIQAASSPSQGHLTPQQAHAISAWTEQATASLEDLTLSETVPVGGRDGDESPSRARSARSAAALRGASTPLSIPLDDPTPAPERRTTETSTARVRLVARSDAPAAETTQKVPAVSFRRREPLRRDSLKRREALQKGKDGSRRRQRWENDRLLHNPWAEPPSPNDWVVQPTYPRHDPLPYYLAPLWDVHYAQLDKQGGKVPRKEKYLVPKELRMRLRHARAARGMLQDIEEGIRTFIGQWTKKQLLLHSEGLHDAPQSDDVEDDSEDEVVFVGRNGQMHDSPTRKTRFREIREAMSTHNERDGEKMVFESLAEDRAAGFGRWLVHSIASYYGLHTWSVTVGEPARREAYVGFRAPAPDKRGLFSMTCDQESMIQPGEELPSPLWAQI